MVSNSVINAMYFAVFLSLIIPFAILFYGLFKKKLKLSKVLISALLFFLLRTFVVNPIANLILLIPGINAFSDYEFVAIIITIIVISLVDIYGRKVIYSLFFKKEIEKNDGLSLGYGYGLSEIQISLCMPILNNLSIALAINNGTITNLVSETTTAAELAQAIAEYSSLEMELFINAGITCILILMIQVVTTFLIMKSLKTQNQNYTLISLVMIFIMNAIYYLISFFNFQLSIILVIIYIILLIYLLKKKKISII
jgi:Predicted membrane protein